MCLEDHLVHFFQDSLDYPCHQELHLYHVDRLHRHAQVHQIHHAAQGHHFHL